MNEQIQATKTTGKYFIEIRHYKDEPGDEYKQQRREYAKSAFLYQLQGLLSDGREYYVKVEFKPEKSLMAAGQVEVRLSEWKMSGLEVEYLEGSIYLLNPADCKVGETFVAIPAIPEHLKNAFMYSDGSRFKAIDKKGRIWQRIA